jgi:hypothetical protein
LAVADPGEDGLPEGVADAGGDPGEERRTEEIVGPQERPGDVAVLAQFVRLDRRRVGIHDPVEGHAESRVELHCHAQVAPAGTRRQEFNDEIGCPLDPILLDDVEARGADEEEVGPGRIMLVEVDLERLDVADAEPGPSAQSRKVTMRQATF